MRYLGNEVVPLLLVTPYRSDNGISLSECETGKLSANNVFILSHKKFKGHFDTSYEEHCN